MSTSEFQVNGSGPQSRLEEEAAEASMSGTGEGYFGDHEKRFVEAVQTEQPQTIYTPHTVVDVVILAKAQGRFINEQTRFLMQGAPYGSKEYTDALSRYSRAQTELITAQQVALHQADII